MASKKEDYELARAMQDIFRDAVKYCMDGNVPKLHETLQSFIAKNPDSTFDDVITGFQSEGKTLVHIAASSGKLEVLEYLIEHLSSDVKAIVNVADDRGFTPLINATISESDAMMKLLIKHGADVNARNKEGASALHFAASDGSVSRMAILTKEGATVDFQSKSGTPLHWAAGKGHSLAIEFLIKHGANVNAVNEDGLPAVLMAAVSGCDKGVKHLVNAGADIGMIVTGNLTPLHICAEHGLFEGVNAIVQTEIGKKCCLIKTTDGENTPLNLAAMWEHYDIVELLLPYSMSTLPEEQVKLEKSDLIKWIINDGKTRLHIWEENHYQKQQQIQAQKNENNHSTVFDNIISPQETLETKTAAENHKNNGNELFKAKKFDEALIEYTKAIEYNKLNEAYWSNRSACYLAMKEYEKALQDAEICRRLNPQWPKGCYRLASARLALGMFEDAAVAAFEGCKLDPSNKELKALVEEAVRKGQEEHKNKNKAETR